MGEQGVLAGVEIGLGTWSWGDRRVWEFGSGYDRDSIHEAFQVSVQSGVRLIDTAEIYGQGQSESFVGQFIAEDGPVVKVATKYMPYPWRTGRRSVLTALEASLGRLGIKTVDLYQIHIPLPPVRVRTWMEALADAHEHGLVRAIGVSNFSAAQCAEAGDELAKHGLVLASNQVEYHLLDRSAERNGVKGFCERNGVALIAYSPMAMGLLTGKYTPANPPGGSRRRRFSPAYLEAIQPLIGSLREIGRAHGEKSPAQVALNWLICKGAIPIPGAKNAGQARENAGAIGWRLSEGEVEALDEASMRVSTAQSVR
jgi:aryl-alcohol dehydrogenase-like predicted oxidoreductase